MPKKPRTRRIRLKPAHDQLDKLLKDLRKVDLTELGPTNPRTARDKDLASWLVTLTRAKQTLREWCPKTTGVNAFGREVPSKRR